MKTIALLVALLGAVAGCGGGMRRRAVLGPVRVAGHVTKGGLRACGRLLESERGSLRGTALPLVNADSSHGAV